MIRGQNMSGRWVSGEFAFVSEDKAKQLSGNLATPGDVVITQRGTLGQVSIVPAEPYARYVLSQSQMKLAPDPTKADSLFLYYLFNDEEQQDYIRRNATQSGVPHTNLGFLRSTPIRLPSVQDQRAIAGVLGALDDKIELNRRMNETLSALARTLYRRLKNEVASEASIYEYAQVAYGAPFASAQFNSHREGMPLIRIRDLATFAPEVWTTQRLPRETVIEPGDLVVGMDGEFRAQIWLGDRALLNQRVCSFRPKNRVPLSFLWQAVRVDLAFYEQAKTGTTVIHLGKSDVDRFTTPAPSVEQLDAFSSQAEPLVAKLVANAQESRTLAELRDTLLPKLISGELRVSDATID
ncbi:MAG: restriction endonuclease subunit S [Gaiellaceae bacterium]